MRLPSLPTLMMLGKASCTVPGAITPTQPALLMIRGPKLTCPMAWVKQLVT
jgi:hypothetical protein